MLFDGRRSSGTNITNCGRVLTNRLGEFVAASRIGRPILALYLSTVFLNAGLLFIIEPMVAKMILPFAGGSSAVWNTSLLFFQASLLLGYLYAHFVSVSLGALRHALLHLILLLAGLLFLPVAIPADWLTAHMKPVVTVLVALTCSIGFPFFVLSAGAPLLQKWLAEARHPSARDPYFMYAASNLGSMLGLLAYPFFLERRLTLTQQADLWFLGYLALLFGTAGCIWLSFRPLGGAANHTAIANDSFDANYGEKFLTAGTIGLGRRLRWLCWSFVPSSLLLGVTSHITTDIVSVPLFWVLPLAIYLLTYVLAFAREHWATHSFVVRRQAFLLLLAAVSVFLHATTPASVLLLLHLLAFFATALLCHGHLAKDRPEPGRLTEFYVWISIGGVLGGFFNSIIAPLLFNSVLEYPLIMVAAAFLRPHLDTGSEGASRWRDWLLPIALLLAILSLLWTTAFLRISSYNAQLLIYAVPAIICLTFGYRPIRFGLGFGAILLGSLIAPHPAGKTLHAERSFFGVYRTVNDTENGRHTLFHGTTIHGAQNVKTSLQPIGYYHRSGPAGQVLRALAQSQPDANVAIVGLGTGALACHGSAGQTFTFFEIDPLVEKIARDEKLFTYLRDCSPKTEVVIGDARLTLAKAPKSFYDLLVLDAFSSDAIPTHLLTLEAIQLYLTKTAPDGIVLIHISNRYMDLVPVLDRLAQRLNLAAFLRNDFNVTAEEQREGKSVSRWIVMARTRGALAIFLDQSWQSLDGRFAGDLWTDDFTDVFKVLALR